jgi:Ca-activated chloride channel family protein
MHIGRALRVLAFSGVLLPMHPLRAQESETLIRASSRLVLLDVVVTDKAGRPIRGLTQEDFTVLENGAPQKITSFEAVASPSSGSGTAANGSRNIILLDELNIAFSDLSYARDRIVTFLDRNPVEKQPTALMVIGPRGLTMVEDFTQNNQDLKDKLTHLKPVNVNSKGGTDSKWAQEHAQAALRALTEIARASVGSPYSFNVIWVTSGFADLVETPGSNNQVEAGLRGVANLLIRSRMRLYTIDPAGVMPFDKPAGHAKVSRGAIQDGHDSSAVKLQTSAHGEQRTADGQLGHMTAIMGGLSYYGRNDVEEAIRQAVEDGSSAYVISYSPSNTSFDGGYRQIEIQMNRPEATARTRKGYYAVADDAVTSKAMAEALWEAAISSPLTYTGLDVSCPATYDGTKDRLTGKLIVTPQRPTLETDQREQVIRVASFSADQKLLNNWLWRVTWKTPWTNRVVSANFDKVLSPKARAVRFLVSDPDAEHVGTCEYRLP